jgi:transposase
VERFVNLIKQDRRVATRYEKTARNFLAFVHVAAVMVLLR